MNIGFGLTIVFIIFSLLYTGINVRMKRPLPFTETILFISILGICVWLHILNIWIAIGALITVAVIVFIVKNPTRKS
ncbi:hypothetical protein [Priestia megaterium]|uniref:Uncharacterized protein n=1 Tax=Priestia megaterium TaxID=1404 RepID=A0A6M6DZY7_PRIMG|nr:hypothetical protein [Priestia megaterium]QJX80312.1 hypothetical protein FDZ14_29925 [Priestia megaterium]